MTSGSGGHEIAAPLTPFVKEFHNGLAQILKFLLGKVQPSEAMFFGPKRGVSLDEFLERIKECGLRFSVTENYDAEIWKHHKELLDGTGPWPSYQKDHCYPLLIKITDAADQCLKRYILFGSVKLTYHGSGRLLVCFEAICHCRLTERKNPCLHSVKMTRPGSNPKLF